MLNVKARDDTVRFFSDLRMGVPIRVLAAPVAVKRIPDFPRFLGYLSSLGALSFHAVLPHADIAVWAYYRLLRADNQMRLIVSACAGITSRLKAERYNAIQYLPPVPSPLVCAAIFLRKYHGYGDRFCFLSPCALKWIEFNSADSGSDFVHYNATIRGIRLYLEREGVDLSRYPALHLEEGGLGIGLTVGAFGSFTSALAQALPGIDGRVEMGLKAVLDGLDDWLESPTYKPLFEPYACISGCEGGSGVRPCGKCLKREIATSSCSDRAKPSRKALLALFERFDRELELRDFIPGGDV